MTPTTEPAAGGDACPYAPRTLERWAWAYLTTTSLADKRTPPPLPRELASQDRTVMPAPLRVTSPGRPSELRVTTRAPKSPGPEAMRAPERRAALVHTFLHHELQAAELMAWAILAFPDTPDAFRTGLLGVARDEIRHMALYEEQLRALGYTYGDFPVRDWFWARVPSVPSPLGFVATFGMGLEGANLDHTARFADRFRAIGDLAGAAVQEQVLAEEVPHVRFALHWFLRWAPDTTFARWAATLPPPLSPLLMRGAPLNRAARIDAGFADEFVEALERWTPA
jgi:uncharacterized ferritin-like protein (DUF455 family)